MKIRTDFVTNSSSSSFTMALFNSPFLSSWLKEKKNMTTEAFASMLADSINGDGSGDECCEKIGKCKDLVDALLRVIDEEDTELCQYLECNRKEVNLSSTARIYCVSQFEGDVPMVTRLVFEQGIPDYEAKDLEEFDEDSVDEITSNAENIEALFKALTPEKIDLLFDCDDDFGEDDADE